MNIHNTMREVMDAITNKYDIIWKDVPQNIKEILKNNAKLVQWKYDNLPDSKYENRNDYSGPCWDSTCYYRINPKKKKLVKFNMITKAIKPPLGITPKYIVDESRKETISKAIIRYAEVKSAIPIEWITEYNELCKD